MMKKRIVSLLIAFVFLLGLSAGWGTARPAAALLADGGDTYTATLQYYDNIQITYTLRYPTGGLWSGAGDVPIGGMDNGEYSFSQIFCADPFVAFHSIANTTWPPPYYTTTDTMGGYTVAAPWATSAAMRRNSDAVRWLVYNGYRGNYNAKSTDPESIASILRLNSMYPEYPGFGPIDETIAVMATKIAVWKILAGDDVQILVTSLEGDAGRKATLNTLVDLLIADARAYAMAPDPAAAGWTDLLLTIEDDPGLEFDDVNDDVYSFYGPLCVRAELVNPDALPDMDKVFLSAVGFQTRDVVFTRDKSTDDAGLLGSGALYGTDRTLQYAEGGASGGEWVSEPFYLRIPAGRLLPDASGILIRAMGMAKGAELYPGTPVTFVHDSYGVQDWNYVQAFVGAARDDMFMNLYAETRASTHLAPRPAPEEPTTLETPLGQIYVSKKVSSGIFFGNIDDTEFTFALYWSGDGGRDRVNLSEHPVIGAIDVDYDANTFSLKNGGLALIDGLPAGPDYDYWVEELNVPADYTTPDFEISSASDAAEFTGQDYSTGWFQLADSDLAATTVEFTNTRQPAQAPAFLYMSKEALVLDEEGGFLYNLSDHFEFILEYSADNGVSWQPYDLSGKFSGDAGNLAEADATAGIFQLQSSDVVIIELNPGYQYRVTEADPGNEFSPSYGLGHILLIDGQPDQSSVTQTTNADSPYWSAAAGRFTTEAFPVTPGDYYFLVFLNTDRSAHSLAVTKAVAGNASEEDRDREYRFQLIYQGSVYGAPVPWATPWPVPLSAEPFAQDAMPVEGIAQDRIEEDEEQNPTIFVLKDGESVTINELFPGQYILREVPTAGLRATYAVDAEKALAVNRAGETGIIRLIGDTTVAFTNTRPYPSVEEETGTPNTPEEPAGTGGSGEQLTTGGEDGQDGRQTDSEEKTGTQGSQDSGRPGGKDKNAAPRPMASGHTLTPNGSGSYIELDEDGVPLGEWRWDEEMEEWIFDEYPPPLGNLPATGDYGSFLLYRFGLAMLIIGLFCAALGLLLRFKAQHNSLR